MIKKNVNIGSIVKKNNNKNNNDKYYTNINTFNNLKNKIKKEKSYFIEKIKLNLKNKNTFNKKNTFFKLKPFLFFYYIDYFNKKNIEKVNKNLDISNYLNLNYFNKIINLKNKKKEKYILREIETNNLLFDAFRDKIEIRDPIKNILDLKLLRWGEDSHLWNKSVDVVFPFYDFTINTENQIIFRKFNKKINKNSISQNKDLIKIKKLDYVNKDRLRILDYYLVNTVSRESEDIIFRAKMWKRLLRGYKPIMYLKNESTFGKNIINS